MNAGGDVGGGAGGLRASSLQSLRLDFLKVGTRQGQCAVAQ